MTHKKTDTGSGKPRPEDSREARLRAALRANLQRRKAQARARADEAGSEKAKDE
ncbi:hypothetical protein [Paenirhodobacter sp. CAU 1674]|jgi:hypothetical protein|uniref:hypothetical protein n=1 Tax=Paenirhodobacter sp. CAU 1674 TaxID=3032596 RepID=UPI0023DBC6D9|nr:hypothetical protein [Paenirhodobacter sp. CAU 1674]MDF2142122.1 hypothetical protein [Paenirhodobacter sp. CAU 1674]